MTIRPRRRAALVTAAGCLAGLAAITATPAGAAGPWSSAGNMAESRASAIAVRLLSGKVLIAGGYASGAHRASAELYDPLTNAFTTTGPLPAARDNPTAMLLRSGKVLVACGQDAGGAQPTSAYLYNPTTGAFSTTTGGLSVGRHGCAMAMLGDGRVAVVGGEDSAGTPSDTVDIYNPATNSFTTATGQLHEPVELPGATTLLDGRVLIAGGFGDNGPSAGASILDPSTNTVMPTQPMGSERYQPRLVTLASGTVLVLGGFGRPLGLATRGDLASAELYDPRTRNFSPTGSMAVRRQSPSATLLADGRVLVVGGRSSIASTEVYDPRTGLFTSAGNLDAGRNQNFAVLLSSGKVLVGGGFSLIGTPPVTTTVSPVAALLFAGPRTPVRWLTKPAATTTASSATFKFSSTGFKPTFQCKLDSGAYRSCSSGKTYTGLAKGIHVLRLRAISLGVVGLPLTYSWRVA